MHKAILDLTVAKARKRFSEGDCPSEPPDSVEHLEDAVIDLADQVANLKKIFVNPETD